MAEKDESKITVHIKSTKQKIDIEILSSQKISDLKAAVREQIGSDVKGEICLIFAGKILKDDDTLESHSINKSGLTIHLVMKPAKTSTTSSSAATSSTSSSNTATSSQTSSSPATSSSTFTTPPPLFPTGGLGGAGLPVDMQAQMQQLMSNPELMRQLMESPLMQGLLSNPEMLQNLLVSNPQIQQLMERNPELSHILHNPDLLRQAMEMAGNQSAMREMMRSQDRQLSNIESLPGGFSALARMYSEIQEPMMDAAQETLQQQLQNNPFAALFSGQTNAPEPGPAAPQGTTNTAPLPNPWGSTNATTQTSSNSRNQSSGASNNASNGTGSAPGSGSGNNQASFVSQMLQNNPELLSQLGGGASAANLMQNPAHRQMYQQMIQNPAMRQMMVQMMQDPAFVQQMTQNMPPALRQTLGNNPEMTAQMMQQSAQMLNNPQMLEMMSNPEALQGMQRMMEGYQQMMSASPAGASALFTPTSTGTSGNTSASNNTSNTGPGGGQLTLPQLQQMMQLLSGSGVPASGGERQNTDQTPEERAAARYSVQLSRLEGMGFVERAANIRALMEANGDINVAIDKLLSRT